MSLINNLKIHVLKEMYRKFPKRFKQLESDFKKYNKKGDKEDKGFIYRELMNLEGTRDSLLQKLKDAEDLLQKKELEVKLVNLSIKVVYLRAIIIFFSEIRKKM